MSSDHVLYVPHTLAANVVPAYAYAARAGGGGGGRGVETMNSIVEAMEYMEVRLFSIATLV